MDLSYDLYTFAKLRSEKNSSALILDNRKQELTERLIELYFCFSIIAELSMSTLYYSFGDLEREKTEKF